MLPLALLAAKKNTSPSPRRGCHFLTHFVCCFYSSSFLPTVYCPHDDLRPAGQPITAVVFHQTRGSKEENMIRNFPLHSLKNCWRLAIFTLQLHTTCMHLLSVTCGYCCAMLPVLSVLQDVTVIQRRRKISRTDIFWLDFASGEFADGGSDSVQCYEA